MWSREEVLGGLREERVAIVFLQMGAPDKPENVRRFLRNLFSDPDIIQLPWFIRPLQPFLASIIAWRRAPRVSQLYQEIGGSPLKENTVEFARLVETELKKHIHARSYIIMRYSNPRAYDVLESLKAYRPSKIVLFTLYPYYSQSTTGSSLNDFYRYWRKAREHFKGTEIIEIRNWLFIEPYVQWWTERIVEEYNATPDEVKEKTVVLFSAHGIPLKYVKRGDPYQEQVEQAFSAIKKDLLGQGVSIPLFLSFQSNVGPVVWLKPYTTEMIESLGKEGFKHLILVPFGFVSEHFETLYEMDILYREEALASGFIKVTRLQTPNTNKDFAKEISRYITSILRDDDD